MSLAVIVVVGVNAEGQDSGRAWSAQDPLSQLVFRRAYFVDEQ